MKKSINETIQIEEIKHFFIGFILFKLFNSILNKKNRWPISWNWPFFESMSFDRMDFGKNMKIYWENLGYYTDNKCCKYEKLHQF